MAILDAVFNFMFHATFVIAPLGAIACLAVLVGLYRRRERP